MTTKHNYLPKWEGAILVTRQLLAPLYLMHYRIKYSHLGTLQLVRRENPEILCDQLKGANTRSSFNILGIWFALFLGTKVVSNALLVGCFILLLSQVCFLYWLAFELNKGLVNL